MRELIRSALAGDEYLSTLLTGGVYAGKEITRQTHAQVFDVNGELKPCALVRLEVEAPNGPHAGGSRLAATVYFYQADGYEVIDQARQRVYDLLVGAKLSDGIWTVEHADDVLDQEDAALGCCLAMSRYSVVRRR